MLLVCHIQARSSSEVQRSFTSFGSSTRSPFHHHTRSHLHIITSPKPLYRNIIPSVHQNHSIAASYHHFIKITLSQHHIITSPKSLYRNIISTNLLDRVIIITVTKSTRSHHQDLILDRHHHHHHTVNPQTVPEQSHHLTINHTKCIQGTVILTRIILSGIRATSCQVVSISTFHILYCF